MKVRFCEYFMMSLSFFYFLISCQAMAQIICGVVKFGEQPFENAKIIAHSDSGIDTLYTNSKGIFHLPLKGKQFSLYAQIPGFTSDTISFSQDSFQTSKDDTIKIIVHPVYTVKEVSIQTNQPLGVQIQPVPYLVENYPKSLLQLNGANNLYEGSQALNGVRPQLNCSVCNTGDIHINGLEGAYTTIMLNGIPLMEGIASVYGLMGIPVAMIKQIEILRFPVSPLLGSNVIGGVINVKTLEPDEAPPRQIRITSESYGEFNGESLFKLRFSKNWVTLNGIQISFLGNRIDNNGDGFTDVALKKQITSFHQVTFHPSDHSHFQFYLRPYWEERWGGELEWTKKWRGSDSLYGENIVTRRMEGMLHAETNLKNLWWKIDASSIVHYQDSWYGTTFLQVRQKDHFFQTYVEKNHSQTEWLIGGGIRYFVYNDNTFLTIENGQIAWLIPFGVGSCTLPLGKQLQSHLGIRYDYHPVHYSIITPRLALKWNLNALNIRFGSTSGFRVVNLFTEDHAALTGARKLVIPEKLKPERSYSIYLNANHFIPVSDQMYLSPSIAIWKTYFRNRIMPDYSVPNKVIYQNLHQGYAINQGIALQINGSWKNLLQGYVGFSLLDNHFFESGEKKKYFLTEPWSAVWSIKLNLNENLSVDYSGSIYGPMMLPLAGELDPRPPYSPIYSLQSIFLEWTHHHLKSRIGVKNLLNFRPYKGIPFLIARPDDPFDKQVTFDNEGNPVPTWNNPYGLTFDTSYIYAPLLGRRLFFEISWQICP